MTDPVRTIADAVLYEGYILWPYRRSSPKNRQRWTFGGVFPPAHSAAHPDDPLVGEPVGRSHAGREQVPRVRSNSAILVIGRIHERHLTQIRHQRVLRAGLQHRHPIVTLIERAQTFPAETVA